MLQISSKQLLYSRSRATLLHVVKVGHSACQRTPVDKQTRHCHPQTAMNRKQKVTRQTLWISPLVFWAIMWWHWLTETRLPAGWQKWRVRLQSALIRDLLLILHQVCWWPQTTLGATDRCPGYSSLLWWRDEITHMCCVTEFKCKNELEMPENCAEHSDTNSLCQYQWKAHYLYTEAG